MALPGLGLPGLALPGLQPRGLAFLDLAFPDLALARAGLGRLGLARAGQAFPSVAVPGPTVPVQASSGLLFPGLALPGLEPHGPTLPAGADTHGEVITETPPATVPTETVAAALDALIEDYRRAGQFHGVVLVARGEEELLRRGVGLADRAWCVPHAPDTRFQIGSITKQFLAAMVLRLAERGRVDLDRPIAEYLPGYGPARGSTLSLHHLLSHTAGVGDVASAEAFEEMMRRPLPTLERLDRYCSAPPKFDPGEAWSYSNCGYEVAGAVVEAVEGRPLRQLVEEFLAEQGLADTGFTDTGAVIPRLAEGYVAAAGSWRRMPRYDWTNALASGSLYSTAGDLERWHRRLLDGRVLASDSLERLFGPVHTGYAYGWYSGWGSVDQIDELLASVRTAAPVPRSREIRVVAHSGDLAGFHTMMAQIVNDPHLVIVLDNHDLTGIYDHRRITHLTSDLVRVLYGRPARGPQGEYGPAKVPEIDPVAAACPDGARHQDSRPRVR